MMSGYWKPGTTLRSQYANLAPDERLRAVLEAGARGDFDERDSLVTSCPRKDYRTLDADFLDRCDASRDLALAVALDLGPRLAEARMLDATRELLLAVQAAAAELDGGDGKPSDDWPFLTGIERCASEIRSRAAAVLEAFRLHCRNQLRLDPEVVLVAHLGEQLVARLDLDQLEAAKPDKAALRAWREFFARKWHEQVED
jgi:hypothetical protein